MASNKRREDPFDKLGRMLLDGIVSQLTEDLILGEVADMDGPQMLESRQERFTESDHLIVPGKADPQFDYVGTEARNVVD